MFKTKQHSTIMRSLAAAATALAIVAIGAPASASAVGHPHITGGAVDFGRNWDPVLSDPLNGGNLHADPDPFTGIVTPRLSGRLYMTNSAGLRGRVRMEYFDAANGWITSRSRIASGPAVTNGMNQFNIAGWAPYGDPYIRRVRVWTQQETAIGSGVYQNIGFDDVG